MTCRACGANIAVKAIVCYKCGTPTADVPEVSRVPVSRVTWRTSLMLFLFVAAVVALAAWLVPKTPEGTWMRWTAWGAIPVVVFGGVRLIRGPRSSRLRRR
jgi:ABC-type uncharacterized transport system permease subunit